MKYIANTFLFCLILLGTVMAVNNAWGWAIASIPLVVWGMPFLVLLHKNLWAALAFWGAIAFIQWQVAVGAFFTYIVILAAREVRASRSDVQAHQKSRQWDINPASGLPMMGGVDIDGNPDGTDFKFIGDD